MNEINSILNLDNLEKKEIIRSLSTENICEIVLLRDRAYIIPLRYCSQKAYLKGLIESSNIC